MSLDKLTDGQFDSMTRSPWERLRSSIRHRGLPRSRPPMRRKAMFEALEQRLLLSGDPLGAVSEGVLRSQLTDQAEHVVVHQVGTSNSGGVIVDLTVDSLTERFGSAEQGIIGLDLDGMGGGDAFELIGLTIAAQISGGADNDRLYIDASGVDRVLSKASGPDSGTIELDGRVITYTGLEPIVIDHVPNIAIRGTTGNDDLVIENDPDDASRLRVRALNGTLESVSFQKLGLVSLSIDAMAGTDSIRVDDSVALAGGALRLFAETTTVDADAAITGASQELLFTGRDLNGLIDALLADFDPLSPPVGAAAEFNSAEGGVPISLEFGDTAFGGARLRLEDVRLSFANLQNVGGGWQGQVGVMATKGVLYPGLLDIELLDDGSDTEAGDDADSHAVAGVIDLAPIAGGYQADATLSLDDIDLEQLGWPGFLDSRITELEYRDGWSRADGDSIDTHGGALHLGVELVGFDTGNEAANDLLSSDNPLFGLDVQGAAAVALDSLNAIEATVQSAPEVNLEGVFLGALASTLASELDGLAGRIRGKLFNVGSLDAGFIVHKVVVDPDGAGPLAEKSASYLAVEGQLTLSPDDEEAGGFDWGNRGTWFGVAFAISELGPLQFFVEAGIEIPRFEPVSGLTIENARLGVRFNTSIEELQTETDFTLTAAQVQVAADPQGGFLVTLDIPDHDFALGNLLRIKDADNAHYDGKFEVLTVNGNRVTYKVETSPGIFVGAANVIRLTITDPLDLRDDGLESGVGIPKDIFVWRDQLDAAVTNQLLAGDNLWAQLFGNVVIGGGATLSIHPIPDTALLIDADLLIDSGGRILISGDLNILDGALVVPAKFYGDLNKLADGSARLLFLSDLPKLPGDVWDPLLVLRGEVEFEALAGSPAVAVQATPDADAVHWDVTVELALDDPSSEYGVGDVAVFFGWRTPGIDGAYVVTAVDDVANTITVQVLGDPGTIEIGNGKVVNEDGLGGGFRIALEGGVDLNVPGVASSGPITLTTLTLDGRSSLEVRIPGPAVPEDVLIDLAFEASLTASGIGQIGFANGQFHLSFDADVGIDAAHPFGGLDIWGAAVLTTDFEFLNPFGLFATATGLLRINSSDTQKPAEVLFDVDGNEIAIALPARSFALRLDGGVDFRIDFNANGVFAPEEAAFTIDGTFVLDFSAEQGFNVAVFRESGGNVLPASLFLGARDAGSGLVFDIFAFVAVRQDGFAANLALSASGGLAFGVLVSLDADFAFIVNTTGRDIRFDIPGGGTDPNRPAGLALTIPRAAPVNPSIVLANLSLNDLINGAAWVVAPTLPGAAYGVVFVKGTLSLLADLVTLDASGYMLLSPNVLSMELNLSGEAFLGLRGVAGAGARIAGSIFLSTQGEFDLRIDAGFFLGVSGFNISGDAELHVSYLDSDGKGSGGNGVEVLDVAGSVQGEGEIFFIPFTLPGLNIEYSGTTGVITGRVGPVPIPTIKYATVETLFGDIDIPYPAFEDRYYAFTFGALLATEEPPPPYHLGALDDGVLTLNVGDRALLRNLNDDEIDETVILGSKGPVVGGRQSIEVSMFGVTQTFDNVSRILVEDMAEGSDYLQILEDVAIETEVHFGAGDDTLVAAGPGAVHAFGDAGNDSLAGGSGNDTLDGGADQDRIAGGTGADLLRGGAGRDVLIGGQGADRIEGGEDADEIRWVRGDGNDTAVDGQGGADTLTLEGTADADQMRVAAAGSGSGFAIEWTGAGAFGAVGIETLNVRGFGGGDTVQIDDLTTSTLRQVNVELGADSAADSVIVNGTSGVDRYAVAAGTAERLLIANDLSVVTLDADVLSIRREGGAAIDVFDANANSGGDHVTISTAGGDDLVRVGTLDSTVPGQLDGIDVLLSIRGGGDADVLEIDNRAATGIATMTLTGSSLTGLGMAAGITFEAIEQLNVELGSGKDTVSVGDISAVQQLSGTAFELNLGEGNDVLTAIGGDLTVLGGAGIDTIRIGNGNSIIRGGADNDIITVGDGGHSIWGDDGVDRITAGNATSASRIVGGAGSDIINVGNGDFDIWGDDAPGESSGTAGGDRIEVGTGASRIHGGAGNDVINAASGDHSIWGDDGDDTIVGGDALNLMRIRGGGGGDSILVGNGLYDIWGDDEPGSDTGAAGVDTIAVGTGNATIRGGAQADTITAGDGDHVIWGDDAPGESTGPAGVDTIRIGVGNGIVYGGGEGDAIDAAGGAHSIFGEGGDDRITFGDAPQLARIFGGGGGDVIETGAGNFLIWGDDDPAGESTGGAGADTIDVGIGDSLVHGGGGADVITLATGNHQVWGDGGDDEITAGDAPILTRIIGGAGFDAVVAGNGNFEIWGDDAPGEGSGSAGADTITVGVGAGQIHGGADRDVIVVAGGDNTVWGDEGADRITTGDGRDTIFGGDGDDVVDAGDGDDSVFGGSGMDDLRGGRGNDTLWGGVDTDRLDGQQGDDTLFGGSGIDILVFDQSPGAAQDVIDGHQGNAAPFDTIDDNATDILVIEGTQNNDTIRVGEDAEGRLVVSMAGAPDRTLVWRDANGRPVVEQIQINGLGGNDDIGFVEGVGAVDFSQLLGRSDDYVGVLLGGTGNDTLRGTQAADRIEGGAGSDVLYGYAGDDQLWGDVGDGNPNDHDILFAGQGNDDLIGGHGTNDLYAWSRDPKPLGDTQFGVFVDALGMLHDNDGGGLYALENTGMNRMLGSERADRLFGGTGLDFLYGNGGEDVLYRRDGSPLESLDGGAVSGEEWKAYARESTQVWYYSGTNANDFITVDFVTEPGLLGDHHLITRLTETNGYFSFDASVRLDFRATDEHGGLIWNPRRLLDVAEQAGASGEADFSLQEGVSANALLPPEGDFQAIIIDALGGDDRIVVGPTVQKSVWIDAGAGDDQVEILGGKSILADKTELGTRNDMAAFAEDLGRAAAPTLRYVPDRTEPADPAPYDLGTLDDLIVAQGLTLDAADDIDRFVFTLSANGGAQDVLHVSRLAGSDGALQVRLYATGIEVDVPRAEQGLTTSVALAGLAAGEYLLEVLSADGTPAGYALTPEVGLAGTRVLNLGVPGPAIAHATTFAGMTLDSAADVDFYRFRLAFAGELVFDPALVNVAITDEAEQVVDPQALAANTEYLMRVESPNLVPAVYDLTFTPGAGVPVVVDLATHPAGERRDIVLGGDGNDVLVGGPGRDWIFGQDGNDVLAGGLDRNAGDLLFGGEGDDTFQLVPDALPLLKGQADSTFIPTFSDQLFGGDGTDRALFLGGDFDRRGIEVPDYVSLRYNILLHRYELTALVWDIGTQAYRTTTLGGDTFYAQSYMFYQTHDVERTEFDLGAGNDVLRLDSEFKFPPIIRQGDAWVVDTSDTSNLSEWGLDLGDAEQGAREAAVRVSAGAGNDRIFGGPLADVIDGGPGADLLVGGPGDDEIVGGGGADTIYGNLPGAGEVAGDGYWFTAPQPVRFQPFTPEPFVYPTALPLLDIGEVPRPGVDLNVALGEIGDIALGLEQLAGGALSPLRGIGDWNGDGFDDAIVSSATHSYLLLGPVKFEDLETVGTYAEIVIDHAALGRPSHGIGDVNGDGISDLGFVRTDGDDLLITVVFGGSVASNVNGVNTFWPRVWDAPFVANTLFQSGTGSNSRLIRLGGNPLSTSGTVALQWLEITGDGKSDLMIAADTTTGALSPVTGTYNYGYLYSGQTLTAATGELGLSDRLAKIRAEGNLPVLPAYVAGDLNGDGLDEILFDRHITGVEIAGVTPASVAAQGSPIIATGLHSDLTITVGSVTQTFTITQSPGSSATALREQINSRILASPLAHRVEATVVGGKLAFTTDDGGTDVQISVSEAYQIRPFGFTAQQTDQALKNFVITPSSTVTIAGNAVTFPGTFTRLADDPVSVTAQQSAEIYPTLGSRLAVTYSESQGSGGNIAFEGRPVIRAEARVNQTKSATLNVTQGSDLPAVVNALNQQLGASNNLKHQKYFSVGTPSLQRPDWLGSLFGAATVATTKINVSGLNATAHAGTSLSGFIDLYGFFEFDDPGTFTPNDYVFALTLISASGSVIVDRENLRATSGRDESLLRQTFSVANTPAILNGDWTLIMRFYARDLFDSNSGNNSRLDYAVLDLSVPFAQVRAAGETMVVDLVNAPVYHEGISLTVDADVVTTPPLGISAVRTTTGSVVSSSTALAPMLGTLPATGEAVITLIGGGVAGAPVVLGDLNNDGYDDFAFSSGTDLQVMLGAANIHETIVGSIVPAFTVLGANLSATAGDFDGDGTIDLAVAGGASSTNFGIFDNVAAYAPGTTLSVPWMEQYASEILDFSSEYSPTDWGAVQVLGAENTSAYGDLPTAWAPLPQNGTLEYVVAGFATPVHANGVVIRETWGNGFVYQIDLLDTADVLHTIWTGVDPSQPGSPADFAIDFARTEYLVKGVKVYVDTDHNPGTWEEIDAIRLFGSADSAMVGTLASGAAVIAASDLDGDGVDDLMLAPATALTGRGQSYVIYGARTLVPIARDVDNLETVSFPGVGGYVEGAGHQFAIAGGGEAERWFRFNTLGDGQPGDAIVLVSDSGQGNVLGDLVDAQGHRLASTQSAFDLRTLEAGTYYLRVQVPVQGAAIPFAILFDAPTAGMTHESSRVPDRDNIHAGDGDDIIVGNAQVDRLFGESGADQVAGEPWELRDQDIADRIIPVATGEASFETPSPVLDPVIVIDNAALHVKIAAALGLPVTTDFRGDPLVHGEIRATDLARITALDLSSSGLTEITVLGQMFNLRELSLAGNPGLTDIAPLGGLTKLRSLALEGTGIDPNSPAVRSLLAQFTRLEVLTLPVVGLRPGQDLAFDEGESVSLNGGAAWVSVGNGGSGWSVSGSLTAVGSGLPVEFVPGDNGVAVVTVGSGVQFPIVVRNVAPRLTDLVTTVIEQGGTTSLSGTIVDPGTLDTFVLDIDWGDPLAANNIEQVSFGPGANGTQSFTLTHHYANRSTPPGGAYVVALKLRDDDGGVGAGSVNVAVENVAPSLGDLQVQVIDEDGTTTLTGTISDPGTLDSFTLDIDWGDPLSPGNLEQVQFLASATGSQTFALTHRYSDDRPSGTPSDLYVIRLVLTDSDGAAAPAATIEVRVDNVVPTLAPVDDQQGVEGTPVVVELAAHDVNDDVLTWALMLAPDGASIDQNGVLTWTPPDGPVTETVIVRVTDDDGGFAERSFDVVVADAAPVLDVTGANAIFLGESHAIALAANDPGQDPIVGWTISWGDGSMEEFDAAVLGASHTYVALGDYTIQVSARNDDGTFDAAPLLVSVLPDTLVVDSFTATDSGFSVRFNRAVDVARLNVYDTEAADFGPADVVLTSADGVVRGSVILDADAQGFSFLATGGALAAGSYVAMLAARSDGFTEFDATLLDGNGDGVPGGDYLAQFTVAGEGALLSIIDIARGPGQSVDQPATGNGIAVTLSNALGATEVTFTLGYDSALLDVSGMELGAGVPAGSTLVLTARPAGSITATVRFATALATDAALELVRMQSSVPLSAAGLYGQKQILDLRSAALDGGRALRTDDGVHVNAYVGDANANRGYNTLDVQRLQRVIAAYDSGFAAYPLLDPAIIGDTTGNGTLSTLDAMRLQQRVDGRIQLAIPALPVPALPLEVFSGADPMVSVGTVQGVAGTNVVVPIDLDEVAGLESIQLTLHYPQTYLTFGGVTPVGVVADFQFRSIRHEPGTIVIDMSRLEPVGTTGGSRLFELYFHVASDSPDGELLIDLASGALNDTALTLNPQPQPGADATDGRIAVASKPQTVVRGMLPRILDRVRAAFVGSTSQPGTPIEAQAVNAFTSAPSTNDVVRSIAAAITTTPHHDLGCEPRPWLQSFVNKSPAAAATNPNSGLKVVLSASTRVDARISTLDRA